MGCSVAESDAGTGARRRASTGEILLCGLVGSMLTCVAGAAANGVLEVGWTAELWPWMLRRIGVGYGAAVFVVVCIFPSLMPRLMMLWRAGTASAERGPARRWRSVRGMMMAMTERQK